MTTTAICETNDISEMLTKFELLDGVADEIISELAASSKLVEFETGDCIFRENDLARSVYLIASGRVSLVVCRPRVGCRQMMDLGPGELLGWSPLAQRPRLSATAHVREATTAIEIDGEQLAELCHRNPAFFCEFMSRVVQIVAQRLSATRLQLLELSGMQLPEVAIESD